MRADNPLNACVRLRRTTSPPALRDIYTAPSLLWPSGSMVQNRHRRLVRYLASVCPAPTYLAQIKPNAALREAPPERQHSAFAPARRPGTVLWWLTETMLMLALLALTAEPELQVRASAAFVHPVWVDLACDPRGAWCSVPRAPPACARPLFPLPACGRACGFSFRSFRSVRGFWGNRRTLCLALPRTSVRQAIT